MRLAVTIQNETLDDLVTRVYAFERKPTQSAFRSARSALTTANPYLRRLEEVPPGTVFAVPEISEAAPSDQTEDAGPMVGGVTVDQLRGAVMVAAGQLSSELEAEIADARNVEAMARSGELRDLRREFEKLKEELPTLAQAASARVEGARELQAYQKRAFAELENDLGELVAAFGTSG